MKTRAMLLPLASLLVVGAGCKRRDTDDPDVAAGYRGNNQYEDDIVTATKRRDYKDAGTAIKPKTLLSIEHSIENVYEKDFERCLEEQMDEYETRFIRCAFTVEFKIDVKGNAGSAKILEIMVRKQTPKGADLGEVDSAGMKSCISQSIDEWEFDPAPEADYLHTYRGQVGEAF